MSYINDEELKEALGYDLETGVVEVSLMQVIRDNFDEFEKTIKAFGVLPKTKLKGGGALKFICSQMAKKGDIIEPNKLSVYLSIIRKERGLVKNAKTKTKPVPMKQAIQTTSNQTIKKEVVEQKEVVKSFNPDMHITSTLHVFPEWLPLGFELKDKSIDEIRNAWKDKYWDNSSVKSKKEYGERAMWNVCEGMPNDLLIESIMNSHTGLIEITQELADFLLYLEYKLPGILSTESPKSEPSIAERLKDKEYPFADIISTDYNKKFSTISVYLRYMKHLKSIKAAVERNEYVPNDKGRNVWTD